MFAKWAAHRGVVRGRSGRDVCPTRELPADRFIDLQFRETVSDPLGQFRRTMHRMGVAVTPEDERAAAAWMSAHGRESHPPHHYKLEDYGLTQENIAKAFKRYHDTYVQ